MTENIILQRLQKAHDDGRVNENALAELLDELNQGYPLGREMLEATFGVEAISALGLPPVAAPATDEAPAPTELEPIGPPLFQLSVEDFYRGCAIAGFCALSFGTDGSLEIPAIVRHAESVVTELVAKGVL